MEDSTNPVDNNSINTPSGPVNIFTASVPKTLTAGVSVPHNSGIVFSVTGDNSTPTFSFTGLPSGIIAGSLTALTPIPSVELYTYDIPLSGTAQNTGSFKPILTITLTGRTGASYNFPFSLIVRAKNSKAINSPTPTSQGASNPALLMASPSSSPATITPVQTTQNQPVIKKPDLKLTTHTSKIKSFFSGIGNFFKSIGRWFKK